MRSHVLELFDMLFGSPTATQMKQWKERLKYTGAQMANILGLKSSRRWRELTNENDPQGVAPANLFMGAALTVLPQKEINLVLEEMRAIGATIDLTAASDSPEQAGE